MSRGVGEPEVRLRGSAKEPVAQHKAQHTGDVSHLCSKEKTLGVEVLCYDHALLVTGYDVLLSTLQGNPFIFFFRIILRLDPCRTGSFLIIDLHLRHHALSDSCLEPPITCTASWTASFL